MEFQRSETDTRRIRIIDVSHLFYKYAWGGAASLSSTLIIDGIAQRVDTTLPTYVIKTIHRWSKGGYYPTVVCFDGAGCSRSRKAYFVHHQVLEPTEGYKAGRDNQNDDFYKGINITMNLLMQGGVNCLKGYGYEADDLIKAAVDRAKIEYPDLPIDVITGDVDLVPLVDEQVSVFLSSKKMTWAESKELEILHYVQLTPANYQSYMEDLSAYNKLLVPYNTILLAKLLRGDKSDKVPAYPKFTPTKYCSLISDMAEDYVDFAEIFRYDAPTETICYRGTEEHIPLELLDSVPREQKMIKYGEPPCLTEIKETLSRYLDSDIIRHVETIYNGININGAFTGLPDGLNRRPAKLKPKTEGGHAITGYDAGALQVAVSVVQIQLPMF